MNNSTGAERTGNTAYRDPTGYILGGTFGACGFALVLYFPLFNLLETYWHTLIIMPYSDPLRLFEGWQILGALLAHPPLFFETTLKNEPSVIADIFIRLTVPVFVSFTLTWLILRNDVKPQKTELLERGKAVESNEKTFKKTVATKLKAADGIRIHADVNIPKDRESEHILVAGATGAGKSQALTHIISSVRERQDRAIIFDIKCDYTAQLVSNNPSERKAAGVYLVAPWDERSIQWNIAADIQDEIAAQSFAEAFIPFSGNESNPYFTQAAQDVLSGCIEFLYTQKPKKWGWKDLQNLLSSVERISAALESIGHAAAQHIQLKDSGVSPQTQGVLGSLRAPLKSLDIIAKYWNKSGGTSIVNRYMQDNAKGTLILAARPDMQSIATPLIAGLLALLMQKGLSLSDNKQRRIWFIIDELGALPKVSKLVDFITLARSKGLCLVCGIQDLGRLYSKYGKDETTTIASQFGTHLIGRLGDGDTAKWAADLFGQQRIERLQISESQQNAVAGLTYQPSVSTTWQQSDKASLIDSDFLHLDKATETGFYVWCRLTDNTGKALLGKLHYEINPVPAPFPACVNKKIQPNKPVIAPAASIKKANDILDIIDKKTQKQPVKVNSRQALYERRLEAAKKHGNKDEVSQAQNELDAIIENKNTDKTELQKEDEKQLEADGIGTEIAKEAMSAIVPGIDILMEVSEALGGEVTNEGAGQTQQQCKKKKRRFRIKRESAIDGGME